MAVCSSIAYLDEGGLAFLPFKELEEKYARKESNARYIAAIYARLGEKDKAFAWLEKAFQAQEDLGDSRWRIPYESIRDDPRYKDLLKRMGLPE